jgi:hypothetical protein
LHPSPKIRTLRRDGPEKDGGEPIPHPETIRRYVFRIDPELLKYFKN